MIQQKEQHNGTARGGTTPPRLASMNEAAERLESAGFVTAELSPPNQDQMYRDRSTVIVCPTRGQIDTRVIDSWEPMIRPMNAKRLGPIFARGYEVGKAYDALISNILEHEHLKTWKYILTLEDDNIPPPDAHIRLLEVLEAHPEFDAVAGLYHTKDPTRTPMAYGYVEEFRKTGRTNHVPLPPSMLDPDGGPVEVLGIPMGCTLWRMDLFRTVPPSWFMTLDRLILTDDGLVPCDQLTIEQSAGAKRCMTQDMSFCDVAVRKYGRRFAVVPSVKVGHLCLDDGTVY